MPACNSMSSIRTKSRAECIASLASTSAVSPGSLTSPVSMYTGHFRFSNSSPSRHNSVVFPAPTSPTIISKRLSVPERVSASSRLT